VGAEVVHQNRLATSNALQTGAEMAGRAVVSADGREITMSLAPVFQTATDVPEVKLSAIPGGK
jgi:ATP phosphoribosyltransferase regulatory subunit HisZ